VHIGLEGKQDRDEIERPGKKIACISIITVASSDKMKGRTEEEQKAKKNRKEF